MGQQVANVKLTDEKIKLVIPWSEVLEYLYLFPQHGGVSPSYLTSPLDTTSFRDYSNHPVEYNNERCWYPV